LTQNDTVRLFTALDGHAIEWHDFEIYAFGRAVYELSGTGDADALSDY
jgi:hypothetical protein